MKKINDKEVQLIDPQQLQNMIISHTAQISDLYTKLRVQEAEIQKLKCFQTNYTQTYKIKHQFSRKQLADMIKKKVKTYNKGFDQYELLTTKRTEIQNKLKDVPIVGAWKLYQETLKKLNVYSNRYYKNMEGNQCKNYRENWYKINNHIKAKKYYREFKPVMDNYNELIGIISQSKQFVSTEECNRAKQLLTSLHNKWLNAKRKMGLKENMPPKYSYLHQYVEMMCLFQIPIGYFNDQSVEGYNKLFMRIMAAYLNQLGILKVKYPMMKLYLITSPKYYDMYR
eukprot:543874_1